MRRERILKELVPTLEERYRRIEREPLPANLGAVLDAAASLAPDAPAIDFFESGERATFGELRARVNRVAHGLHALGVRRGTHVAVMLPNILAFPITWLAIARLGAVMIPTNIGYTGRELHYVLTDGEADFLVIDEECVPRLGEMPSWPENLKEANIIVRGAAGAHRAWSMLEEGQPATVRASDAPGLDDLVNIQYTSGTTGFPKGCMLPQRYWLTIGKVNALRDGRDYRRIFAATPFFYMDPQWLLMMAIYRRATLVIARRQSASRFWGWVREHRVNFCFLPEIILKQPARPDDSDHQVIRANCYGLSKQAHVEAEARFDLVAREAFGMTEIGSGMFVPMEATETIGTGTCGRRSPFREVRVVNDKGETLPPGELGELVVRGPGMLQGYYNKKEATENAFFGEWFRTGDVFRMDEQGWCYIVGRIKDMIRRSGENIAAREVEAVLRMLPEVAEAAAVPVPDPARGEEVKIYVVLKPGFSREQVDPAHIIAHCEAHLARFKVPRYVAYRDALPHTPSEKIAKHVLTAEHPDRRTGAFDRVDGVWR
jgi:crotonobetaine/carnitine-CoA ligase